MTIADFQRIFTEHSPCEEGKEAFLGCLSRMEAYDLAASPQGSEFLINSICEGWGPSAEDIHRSLKAFVNGKRIYHHVIGDRDIGIQIWCCTDRVEVSDKVRHVVVIGCVGEFVVRPWQTVKVTMDPTSSLTFRCPQNSLVYIDNNGGFVNDVNGNCRIRNKNRE